MSATAAPARPVTHDRPSFRRVLHLSRWNAVLAGRNRLAMFNGVVLPLLPLLLLLVGERGEPASGASTITTLALLAGLFPVYYNVLAQFVSRRDELVLKRMRTGEVRDLELLVGIAVPGVVSALLVTAVAVPVSAALGQPLPVNPVLLAAGTLLTLTMFSALAYWTAGWTRSAEAAQLTSMPVIILVSVGPLTAAFDTLPSLVERALALTPGHAIGELVRTTWFGFDGADAAAPSLSTAGTWAASAEPLLVLAVWTALGVDLARRSLRWEPRS